MDRKSTHVIRATSRTSSRIGSRTGSSMSFNPSASRASRLHMSSKSNLFSSSRKNLTSESMKFQKPMAQILDDGGEDVTPQSMLQQKHYSSLRRNQSNMFGVETGTPNESLFQQSIYGTTFATASFSQPFSRSVFSSSMTDAGTTSLASSITDEIVQPPTTQPGQQLKEVDAKEHVEESKELTEDDLETEVHINLTETDTIWLLDIPGTCVALDSEEAEQVKKRNEIYQELLKGRPGNDRYSDRGMQTINDAPKVKTVQTEAVEQTESGMTVSTWDMYDTYQAVKEAGAGKSEEETLEDLSSRTASRITSGASWRSRAPTSMGISTIPEEGGPGSTIIPGESVFVASMITDTADVHPSSSQPGVEKKAEIDPTKPNDHPILKMDKLKDTLRIAERAITENIFQPKQALYRNLPILQDPDHPVSSLDALVISTPHLEKLWSFSCPLTQKRNVTCMAWNPFNKDIVAVGYGQFSLDIENIGLICCWSLKNPSHPERIYHAPSGITSLSFSHNHPNLLAAGLYSGNVVLYNVRSTAHDSVLDSRDALHKHSGPVWQVKWVVKEHSMGENNTEHLVSISVDGRILQWSIRKGFESSQLMKLKRMITPKTQEKRTTKSKGRINPASTSNLNPGLGEEAYISQHAPGMGFDFWPHDSNVYLVCTEEGYIHKCSCSYNEQVLETYTGHTGPVNRVCWSPFVADIFLSCSADWTVKLWNQELTAPMHTFKIAQKAINDVCWSPISSTMFACATDGKVEIWDLDTSVLDPLMTHKPHSGVNQTCVSFAQEAEVILVGDCVGEVTVYLLKNVPKPPTNQEEALMAAVKSSHKDLSAFT